MNIHLSGCECYVWMYGMTGNNFKKNNLDYSLNISMKQTINTTVTLIAHVPLH